MNESSSYEHLRFARGYLITPEAKAVELPTLEGWAQHRHAGYVIRIHPDADLHVLETDRGDTWLLLGHAYDPWKGEHDERVLLEGLDAGQRQSDEAFLETLDRLSGRFVLFHFRSGRHRDGGAGRRRAQEPVLHLYA